jgi:pentatricopeptide repeat protein
VHRYVAADDFGVPTMAFTACTFWFIDALARAGEVSEARELFEDLLGREPVKLDERQDFVLVGNLTGNAPTPATVPIAGAANSHARRASALDRGARLERRQCPVSRPRSAGEVRARKVDESQPESAQVMGLIAGRGIELLQFDLGAIKISATHLGVGISTTHTITGAIVGVGATRRLSAVRWGVARQIVWAWVLTIPAAAFVGAVSYRILALFGAG